MAICFSQTAEREVKARIFQYVGHINAGEFDKVLEFFTDDIEMVLPRRPIVKGIEGNLQAIYFRCHCVSTPRKVDDATF